MSKKILVISTSLRKNSDSNTMSDYFIEGATTRNHNIEKITLHHK